MVTNLFGRVRHMVAWGDVAALNHMSNLSPLPAFHRFEIVRRGAKPVALLALGMKSDLPEALLSEAARGGIR